MQQTPRSADTRPLRGGYRPEITTVDLWPQLVDHVGSDRHASLIDELAACLGPDDEELLLMLKNKVNEDEVARDLHVSQQAVSARFRRILARANKCNVRETCRCHERGQRHSD